jgi:hypothetical protein
MVFTVGTVNKDQPMTKLTQITHSNGLPTTTRITRTVSDDPAGYVLAERAIYYVLGIVEVTLAFRFVLALLGANRGNDFAQLIFNVSNPLVQPFFSLFSYQPTYGANHVEVFTLVAMAVYAVLAWGITALLDLPRRGNDV